MAQNMMQTAFRWQKALCEQRFDGSKHYVNNVPMAQKYYVNRVSMAQTIMLTAFQWLKILCKQVSDGSDL